MRSEVPGCLGVAMSIAHGLGHGLKVTLRVSHCSEKGEKQLKAHLIRKFRNFEVKCDCS